MGKSNNRMKKNTKETISISIDKSLNENMEKDSVNKSNLINKLLKEYLKDDNPDKKRFNKK